MDRSDNDGRTHRPLAVLRARHEHSFTHAA
jgi:hypothetical protein